MDFASDLPLPMSLPRELCDLIIDYLHADRAALAACALVCRAWVPASRFHLFDHISLSETTGRAAVVLNTLLSNPHASMGRSVRSLDLFDALAPIQITYNRAHKPPDIKPLLTLVPHIGRLTHIHTLALTDLPFDLLPSGCFPRVQRLILIGVTAGPALLRLATALPGLRYVAMTRVLAIPYRPSSKLPHKQTETLDDLRTVTIHGSSIAFIGFLAILAPGTRALSITDFFPSEIPYLVAYLSELTAPLVRLEIQVGAWVASKEWGEFARAVGIETYVVFRIHVAVPAGEGPIAEEAMFRDQFGQLDELGMLDIVTTFEEVDFDGGVEE
ncbi:hypothetical protein FB45DRAFT_901910 [Roridomyces roridus]|uniref:F-box domain-containing protein n=1 Tax=Roridomyces roridus TaxID=1738132 RepID=A0AAD7F7S7_9AGAR|nr:hypothetical protein FB45DRAFT_966754 [Roridomyces roridus]KAJ7642152.1 hypothetical protein FB45DRAFT_901910 [Roridomyces roridus]